MFRERDDMLAYRLHCIALWSLDIGAFVGVSGFGCDSGGKGVWMAG
jgi:hypothetical protein